MPKLSVGNVVFGEGRPKIIVPIVGKTEEEILEAAEDIKNLDCDLVEWRIDFFNEVKVNEKVANISKKVRDAIARPLLVTFRTKKEGGVLELEDSKYFEIYHNLINHGEVDLLDVELFMNSVDVNKLIEAAHEKDIKIVMCNHDFDATPACEEIVQRLVSMEEKGADICKIAVMPNESKDVLTLLEATRLASKKVNKPLITMSMGSLGMISRIAGEAFGSAATFGSAKEASAPGQVPVSELRKILEIVKLD